MIQYVIVSIQTLANKSFLFVYWMYSEEKVSWVIIKYLGLLFTIYSFQLSLFDDT